MSKVAVEQIFTGLTTSITSYDSTKTNLGSLMRQITGATTGDNFVGPMPIGLARPMEASTAIPVIYPHVSTFDTTTDYVFFADNATAAATRRIVLYEFNKQTSTFNWKGFITATFPNPGAAAYTIRGLRSFRDLYTAGTVSLSGVSVSGDSSTAWVSDRLSAGSRIGFGSTNPAAITTWYSAVTIINNTGITLSQSAGVSGLSTPYVIEDLRIGLSMTNATATNSGLFLIKGLSIEAFTPTGTNIPTGSTDNARQTYWLKDALVQTNTAPAGISMEDRLDWQTHYAYILDTSNRVFKYNIRATLGTPTGGISTSAFTLSTGVQTPTGTMSQVNNGRVQVLNHGPGNGVNCLYWVTTTRIYRSPLSAITNGSVTWQADAMVEVPPGGINTFAASSTMSSLEAVSSLDSLMILNTGANNARSYMTKYNTISTPMDRIFLSEDRQLDQSIASVDIVPHPSIQLSQFSNWSEGGISYMTRHSTNAANNQVYAIPYGADWAYASSTGQRIITPEMFTPGAIRFYRAYTQNNPNLGSITMGLDTEPFRTYYRTNGISDNSGNWTLLNALGDLSGVGGANSIQFMFEFKIIGPYCIPARILSIACVYEDTSTDTHYQPSIGLSDKTTKAFAWRFSTAFASTVPTLRVRLYDAVTNSLLVDDNTAAPTGTFEQSTNSGSSWAAWTNADKTNENTYIRYTPASLGDNIKVRALLTLN